MSYSIGGGRDGHSHVRVCLILVNVSNVLEGGYDRSELLAALRMLGNVVIPVLIFHSALDDMSDLQFDELRCFKSEMGRLKQR